MKVQSRQRILFSLKSLFAKKRFADESEWQKVRVAHSLNLYLPGGGPARVAFLAEVHKTEPYNSDGVSLHPDDVRHTSTVREYNSAIKQWYRNNEFTLKP